MTELLKALFTLAIVVAISGGLGYFIVESAGGDVPYNLNDLNIDLEYTNQKPYTKSEADDKVLEKRGHYFIHSEECEVCNHDAF
jgi:hypothetical protein